MKTKTEKQRTETEQFFKDAFCAQSAKLLPTTTGFAILGVVEIVRAGKKMFIAAVEPSIHEGEQL